MPKISIKEQNAGKNDSDSFSVSVSFNDSDEFPGIIVENPLTDRNRARLEWHFEHYISYPYLNTVEPKDAQAIIKEEVRRFLPSCLARPILITGIGNSFVMKD
jgi:hypothetical protein